MAPRRPRIRKRTRSGVPFREGGVVRTLAALAHELSARRATQQRSLGQDDQRLDERRAAPDRAMLNEARRALAGPEVGISGFGSTVHAVTSGTLLLFTRFTARARSSSSTSHDP